MFNSVAKYLWGDSTDVEQAYKEASELKENEENCEALDVQQADDDWVVVGQSDKENSGHHSHPTHHHHHLHSHRHSHHLCQQAQSAVAADSEPMGFPFGISDNDLLDEASSLERDSSDSSQSGHLAANCLSDPLQHALQDCNGVLNLNHFDLDSNYSSDGESGGDSGVRPSSPESVFSACSGRSHATYRPKGSHRDPWILTPPPCFTGSRAGELSTISSSPLENLLIEHPSMSVYLSVPPSSLPPSHPFHLAYLAARQASVAKDEGEQEDQTAEVKEESRLPTVDERRREVQHRHWGVPAANQTTAEQITAEIHAAQRTQIELRNKALSSRQVRKENKVYDKSYCKNNSKRSKRFRPSGCKSGRVCQRV